jgi:GxxExxY protein
MIKDEVLTAQILNACKDVYSELGRGFLEPVYQEALEKEFQLRNIPYEREKKLRISYKGMPLEKEYIADFLCYGKIIVELKAVSSLAKEHKAQTINYLKAANLEIGLLVNFGAEQLKWERISIFNLTREGVSPNSVSESSV